MNVEDLATVNPSPHAEQHIQDYLASDGRDVDHPAGERLILLYTTGRTSGEIRRTPLGSISDGDDLLVVGSNAGRPKEPSWFRNLMVNPQVWVRKQADFYRAEATVLPEQERQVAWEALTEQIPVFADFQAKAGRQLPLIRLTRVDG